MRMNRRTRLMLLVLLVIVITTFLLRFSITSENPKKTLGHAGMENITIERADAKNADAGSVNIDSNDTIVGCEGNVHSITKEVSTEESFTIFYWENGKPVTITNRTIISEIVRMDSNSAEVVEYTRIARAITATSITIPDDVVPIIEIQGEWVVVTFPYVNNIDKNWKHFWSDYYAEIIIDYNTKAVLLVSINRELENKGSRSGEDFATLIAESKATPTAVRYPLGFVPRGELKRILIDSDSQKSTEYVQLARTGHGLRIPDDAEPTVEIQGDNIVVTFNPNRKERVAGQLPSFGEDDPYAEVIIDIKAKVVLWVSEPPN